MKADMPNPADSPMPPGATAFGRTGNIGGARWLRAVALVASSVLLGGCVSTVIGAAAGATVAVATAVVTAPVKLGGAVVDAIGDDDEEEDD